MAAQGSPVTIWCQGSLLADVYHLYKEGGSVYWEAQAPQGSRNKARFHFEYTSPSDAGQYQCAYRSRNRWSERSDPLPLVLTGVYRAPSLSAQPSPVVAAGGSVSLTCSSQYAAGTLHLLKEGGADLPRYQTSRDYGNQGREEAVFPVGPVTSSHGGTYRCYDAPSTLPYLWSHPSDPLHLQVTGMHRKPSLSALPGASVPQEENVTLQCRSEVRSDTFHLFKEGPPAPPQHLRLQDTAPPVRANFTLRAVTAAHSGTYRCYSSQSAAPHLLSLPSDPLELLVSGGADSISPPQNKPDRQSDYTVQNLIRMGLAASVLVLLGVLLCQARHDRGEARDAARS